MLKARKRACKGRSEKVRRRSAELGCVVDLDEAYHFPIVIHGEKDFVASAKSFVIIASANQNCCGDNVNCNNNNMNCYHNNYSCHRNK